MACLLSVAMIVRDEENNIRRALESVKDCVDEIVVVDTGSKDRTPEIAREYTDRVYFHEWQNDFSEARNYSLKFPKCEWVMILDADEEVSDEFCRNIRDFLKNLPDDVNTVFVPTISYLDWDFKRKEFASTARIFRNGTVYYKNIVHNMPVYKPKVVSVPWPIYHYGYIWTRKLRKKKYERTGTLIRKQLKMAKTQTDKLYYLVQLYKTEATGGKPYTKSEVAIETYKELIKAKRIPTIALEFMYYFASDLMNLGYFELAEEILKKAIQIDPDYPDAYFGLVGLYEKKKDWKKIIEWGEKFFEVFGRIVSTLESPRWTVNSMKVTGAASTVLARAYIKEKNFEKASKWLEEALIRSEENGENIERFLDILISDMKDLECDEIKTLFEAIGKAMDFSNERNLNVDFTPVFEKIAECGLNPGDLIEKFQPKDDFSKALKERLIDGRDHLLDVIPHESFKDFVERYGAKGFVFLFDYLVETGRDFKDLLKILNEIRGIEDEKIRSLAYSFMGDVYLKMERFKEALSVYKKALEMFPPISKFLKPVIEDLKTVITGDMEGVFEEIYKDYTKGSEMIWDITEAIPKSWARKLHLISDTDYAAYVSAATSEDPKLMRKLLEKVRKREKFPFFYYRLAKTYEGEDWKKAFVFHKKACEENERLADLKYGVNIYHGLYLSKDPAFSSKDDEVVWAGNITEEFSNLNVISPVRMWMRSKKGFLYVFPYPIDESLKIYWERLDKTRFDRISVDIRDLSELLMKKKPESVKLMGYGYDEEKAKEYLLGFNIGVSEKSGFLLIPFGLESMDYGEFESVLKDVKGGIVVFANPTSEKSRIWRFPPFRIIRPYGYLKDVLEKSGLEIEDVRSLGGDLYALSFSKV